MLSLKWGPCVMPGAVGRVLVHGEDGHRRVQFDLKGKQFSLSGRSTPDTVLWAVLVSGGRTCLFQYSTWHGMAGMALARRSNWRAHVHITAPQNYCAHCTGVVYDARLAPLPGTLCVVNIGQTEAKVEAVMHSFLQLVRSDADNAEVLTSFTGCTAASSYAAVVLWRLCMT
jgi:hypothetical protein